MTETITTTIIHDPSFCVGLTQKGAFCRNKKKHGDFCSIHATSVHATPSNAGTDIQIRIKMSIETTLEKVKTQVDKLSVINDDVIAKGVSPELKVLTVSKESPVKEPHPPVEPIILHDGHKLCCALTKAGENCKNPIKKGNRKYCQVHQ